MDGECSGSEQSSIAFQGLVQAQHELLGKGLLALALGQFLGAGLGRQGLGGMLRSDLVMQGLHFGLGRGHGAFLRLSLIHI